MRPASRPSGNPSAPKNIPVIFREEDRGLTWSKLIKFLLAVALLPFLAAEIWVVCDFLKLALAHHEGNAGWQENWDVATSWARIPWWIDFLGGFLGWLLLFFFLPRATWLYVCGHELTHALVALLTGGKIYRFRVSSSGGDVATNRSGWLISLAPYFIPLYALLWASLWFLANLFVPLSAYLALFYLILGVFWSFHLSFTLTMLQIEQTDLTREGTFFSLVMIALLNLLAVVVWTGALVPRLSWTGKESLAWEHVEEAYRFTAEVLVRLGSVGWEAWMRWNYGEPKK